MRHADTPNQSRDTARQGLPSWVEQQTNRSVCSWEALLHDIPSWVTTLSSWALLRHRLLLQADRLEGFVVVEEHAQAHDLPASQRPGRIVAAIHGDTARPT